MPSEQYAALITPMHLDQLDLVLRNERRAYSHPWTSGIFKDCLQSGHECWVLQVANGLIGHVILSMNICVNPECQGRGYGALLLRHIIERASEQRCRCIFLEVRASNRSAYKLYERFGFTEIGVRKDYYPANAGAEDALVLVKELSLTP
jgi:[ribosomal protein S18]-alanine N-acetyltransferase